MYKIILFFFIPIIVKSQHRDIEISNQLYCVFKDFRNVNSKKYYKFKGIDILCSKNGNFNKFQITFSNKKVKLSKTETKWIYENLKKLDFYFLREFYDSNELKILKNLKGAFPLNTKHLDTLKCLN